MLALAMLAAGAHLADDTVDVPGRNAEAPELQVMAGGRQRNVQSNHSIGSADSN